MVCGTWAVVYLFPFVRTGPNAIESGINPFVTLSNQCGLELYHLNDIC
jgi:hypothetical protein